MELVWWLIESVCNCYTFVRLEGITIFNYQETHSQPTPLEVSVGKKECWLFESTVKVSTCWVGKVNQWTFPLVCFFLSMQIQSKELSATSSFSLLLWKEKTCSFGGMMSAVGPEWAARGKIPHLSSWTLM